MNDLESPKVALLWHMRHARRFLLRCPAQSEVRQLTEACDCQLQPCCHWLYCWREPLKQEFRYGY